jgi:single-stranded-DNA-specific exonuclease
MELQWQALDNYRAEQVLDFAAQLNSSPILAQVMLNRGIQDTAAARRFFLPNIEQLHDPFVMLSMSDAVRRIMTAIKKQEKIYIYGDYDVDGTTATAMLLAFFRDLGQPVDFYIPDRLKEGYGLSEEGIRHIRANGADLVITVDCGITTKDEIDLAGRIGLDVIVCDHHQPGSELPRAIALLNPKRPGCPYPFKELAGVGVAFKLLQALQQHMGISPDVIHKYLDLVAIGSAADIVPLVDENRVFVKHGLQGIHDSESLGLKALLETTGLKGKEIGTGQVIFVLAPRINAVGRMGDAGRAVELFTAGSRQQAMDLAAVLEAENRIRKTIDEETLLAAVEFVETAIDQASENVFVLHGDGWHPGVMGIVASRLVEKYFRPTVMIATENGQGKGSARSIPGFNIYAALKHCEDLMTSFGGHKYAAGLTIASANIPALRRKLNRVAAEELTDEILTPRLWFDTEVRFRELDAPLLKLLKRMAPFGPHNTRPVFVSRGLEVIGAPRVVGKNHLKFKVRQDNIVMDAIGFELGDLLYRVAPGEKDLDMIYVIEENEWMDRKTTQLRVKDLR